MTRQELISQIDQVGSCLCVGLDTDIRKIPEVFLDDPNPMLAFNKMVIDATKDFCIAYKPNIAFYEALGPKGWEVLEETMAYIPKDKFTIADAKRGDIGNTSSLYAEAFFKHFDFDAITVAPYMGEDSVKPFLEYEGKWVIVLGLTSNHGSSDFQMLTTPEGLLYEQVLKKTQEWGTPGNLMFVVGATHPDKFQEIRSIVPDHFLLVPGIGAQGGDLEGVLAGGSNTSCGLLINSSRGIIYAADHDDPQPEIAVSDAARAVQEVMQQFITSTHQS